MNAMRTGAAAIAALLLVAACQATASPSPRPRAASTATSSATPTPSTTSPSPAESSGRVMFSGTLDCGFPEGLAETTEGPMTTYTGKIECTYAASDPRASGTETGLITMVELSMPGFHVNKWFDRSAGFVITNAGGSWRSTEAFGADQWDAKGEAHTIGTAAYVGEGGYAGLRMRLLYAQGTSEPVNAYIVMGWIEPTD